jgi:hypothetical protein
MHPLQYPQHFIFRFYQANLNSLNTIDVYVAKKLIHPFNKIKVTRTIQQKTHFSLELLINSFAESLSGYKVTRASF